MTEGNFGRNDAVDMTHSWQQVQQPLPSLCHPPCAGVARLIPLLLRCCPRSLSRCLAAPALAPAATAAAARAAAAAACCCAALPLAPPALAQCQGGIPLCLACPVGGAGVVRVQRLDGFHDGGVVEAKVLGAGDRRARRRRQVLARGDALRDDAVDAFEDLGGEGAGGAGQEAAMVAADTG